MDAPGYAPVSISNLFCRFTVTFEEVRRVSKLNDLILRCVFETTFRPRRFSLSNKTCRDMICLRNWTIRRDSRFSPINCIFEQQTLYYTLICVF